MMHIVKSSANRLRHLETDYIIIASTQNRKAFTLTCTVEGALLSSAFIGSYK